ncbi:MAG: SPFH domain-containing protein [Lachnospiraceae bacterium]|nr:SPFH domain-containing protein [Lachnospiraceae bacterium]
MGFFSSQFSNVVEWEEYRDDILFWKWHNDEIKKGSRLIIRAGQDAIFMYNGKVEGVFRDEGSFDVESDIIPFLSTLKGFKFGFNSGIRAEVLFINTKEVTIKWGTKNEINIPAPQYNLPGGIPVRAFGTFSCKISDHQALIDKIAGIKDRFTVDDVKERVMAKLDQLIMKWIVKESSDMANLMSRADAIARGIAEDLDMEMTKLGISITDMTIQSISYPKEIQDMITKVASHSMVGNMNTYRDVTVVSAMGSENGGSNAMGNMAQSMAGMQMGMMMGQQMVNSMSGNQQAQPTQTGNSAVPNFCPDCGAKTNGANFCGNCGKKLV